MNHVTDLDHIQRSELWPNNIINLLQEGEDPKRVKIIESSRHLGQDEIHLVVREGNGATFKLEYREGKFTVYRGKLRGYAINFETETGRTYEGHELIERGEKNIM